MDFDKLTEQMKVENPNMTFIMPTSEKKPQYYSLKTLQAKEDPLPDDVDPLNREANLHDKLFEKVFKMDRQSYLALPAWKRQNLKKTVGLYWTKRMQWAISLSSPHSPPLPPTPCCCQIKKNITNIILIT